ncbi:hypothetical protein [Peribacillus sp. NPDC058002]
MVKEMDDVKRFRESGSKNVMATKVFKKESKKRNDVCVGIKGNYQLAGSL